MTKVFKYLTILTVAILVACGGSTEPSHTTPTVHVRTQGYLVNHRMSITDFQPKGLDGRVLTFINGHDTLTEQTATSGYLLLHSDGVMTVDGVDSLEPTTITVPSDTADSAAYKTFNVADTAITCIRDSFPNQQRTFLVDSITNTYTDFFNHDSTDPSGSQLFVTLWLTDTTTGVPQRNQSLPAEFHSIVRLEHRYVRFEYWFSGITPTYNSCRFDAQG
jgi:hypothetical protein